MLKRTLHLSIIFIFLCSLFTYSIVAQAKTSLSQVEHDLLKARMADQLEKENYDDALSSISQIKSSGYTYSPILIYFEGYAFQQSGQLTAAKSAYLTYLEKAGSKGTHYQKALQNIVIIETELDGVLQRYKTLLAQPKSNENLAQMKQLELKLGEITKPLRAEFDKQQLAAAEEAKIKAEAEQERLAAAEIAKKKQTWEVVLGKNSQLADITVTNNNDIVAVGSTKTSQCSAIDSWWLVTLDLLGNQKLNKNSCAISGSSRSPTFFTAVEAAPDGGFYTVGTADKDKQKVQTGSLYRFTDDGNIDWRSEQPSSLKRDGFFHGLHLTRSGKLVTVGSSNKTRRGQAIMFDTNGQKIWDGRISKVFTTSRIFNGVTELNDDRILFVGSVRKSKKAYGAYIQGLSSEGVYDSGVYTLSNTFHDISPMNRNEAMVIGDSWRESSTVQAYIMRIDADSRSNQGGYKIIWRKPYPAEGGSSARKIIRNGDNYIIVGMSTVNSSKQGVIYKINDLGDVIWSESYGGSGDDIFTSVVASPNNDGFIVSGQKYGAGWVMKLNARGQMN